MNPIIRISAVLAAMAGVWLVGRALWPLITSNLAARKSWTLTDAEVRAMNGDIEVELGRDPSAYRAFAKVDHTWGLQLFKRVPVYVDPADRSRIRFAGVFQMWLTPAEMSSLILLLLAMAVIAVFLGRGQSAGASDKAQWLFTSAPGPLADGIKLHSPPKQWKIVLGWSLLGVAMASIVTLSKGGNPAARFWYLALGTGFAMLLWIFAWHTKSMEISANGQGLRMTSVLGWRDVPWEMIHGAEEQDIFTTYYNGNTRMWELPFPGSAVRVIAFNDQHGRTLISFGPGLETADDMRKLIELCAQRTGAKLRRRTIAIHQ